MYPFDLRHDLVSNMKSARERIFSKIKDLDAPDPNGIQKYKESHFCDLMAEALYWAGIREMFA